MIGLGTWLCSVSTLFFSGDVELKIYDKNGEYGFKIFIPDFESPDISVKDVEEDEDTLIATVETSVLEGKDITLKFTFAEDTFDGFIKIPMLGKVKLKKCKRIS